MVALASVAPRADAALVHRYSFASNAADSAGTAHGTLRSGAVVSNGTVALNGTGAYVDLPNGLVSTLTHATFETWLTDDGSGNWARILDFGHSTGGEGASGTGTNYLFLTPQTGGGILRGGIKVGTAAEQNVSWTGTRLPVGTPTHVVWTIDASAQRSRLYVDGAMVAENAAMTLNPSQLGNTYNNWLGRSQFSADAYFKGSLSEFRIYDTALTDADVQRNFARGPEVADSGPVAIVSHPQSQAVLENRAVSFGVDYGGSPPVAVQWFRDGAPIPGATNDTCTIPAAPPSWSGSVFRAALTNVFTNATFTASSSNAVLTVAADTEPPVLVRAASLYPAEVLVTFSEGLLASTATNPANYAIAWAGGALTVTAARVGATASNVILTTGAQLLGTNYTLTVNNVRDLAGAANLIAPDSQASFAASLYVGADIGQPATPGVFTPTAGGYTVTAGGAGLGGAADEFTFGSRPFTNDFDVQVRVSSLYLSDAWARAGLMARDGLSTNARFAAAVATPGPAGCHFLSRAAAGADAAMAGSFPVNFPDTWLRLRRAGNVFSGYASLDGQTWEFLGSATIAMSSVVQVGFAVTASDAGGVTTALFDRDGDGGGVVVTNLALPFEPPGPSSRRTALAITEIMYNPPDAWGGTNNLEFVELWNSGLVTEDLTGFRLSGDIDYAFPGGASIAPGQFLVVARDPAAAQAFYGVACLGPYDGKLPNGGGTLRLRNELGGVLLEVDYDNREPWPVAADGAGHSLVLDRPSYGENDPRAWAAGDAAGGTPGAYEHRGAEPARGVVVNEFLAHTDEPAQDYIELFNTGAAAVDLSGAWLGDEAGATTFRIPDGTSIPARGRLAWNQTALGFSLAAEGERIFLVNSNQTRVLDAVSFGGQANGVPTGRYPDGAPGFQELSAVTEGTANAAPLLRPVVINEILYHPISGSDDDEYVELHNRSAGPVNIGGWTLQDGIGFTFPSNTVLAAGGFAVVGKNLTNLLARYPQLNAANAFGDYSGSLANGGERIALAMPEDLAGTNALGAPVTNSCFIVVDEVTWADGGRWGSWSDGGGSSLELVDPDADNRQPANWADSDETAKAAWTTIDATEVMENGQSASVVNEGNTGLGVANRIEFFLQGPGEAIVDDVVFRSNGGANLVANGDFASGTNGWNRGGVLRGSYAENGAGVGGSRALRLVSTDRGDTGPNKVSRTLNATAATGSPNTGTIRASARWLKGSPRILFRIRGNWMEVSQPLNVPANPGTPGLTNSRRIANAGPAIADVSHEPVLPAANQAVVVVARPLDPDGVGAVTLRYRLDPATSYTAVTMRDDGTGGDARPGDGLYGGTIPGQAGGALAAFYVSASDAAAIPAASSFPAGAPAREGLVRWGESAAAGSLGTYRLWVTSTNIAFWTARERNANDPVDATFVYGRCRAVYNVGTMYSGSPFHTPSYNGPLNAIACDYEVNFPPGDRFLGSGPFVLTAYDVVDGSFFFNDDSAQVDLTGNWIARKFGQPFNHRRHVHMFLNGVRRGTIYDDAQQPNGELLEQFFPGDDACRLRKIESWFEFADDAQTQGSVYATLDRVNRSAGGVDVKRYRWNWRPRATDEPDDWADFTNLVIAVNDTASPVYEAGVRTWMDVRNFLRPVVVHHVCGSWDSYAHSRGKNMYACKPDGRPWRLLMWDIELALGADGNAATDNIYTMVDKSLLRMITNSPAFHREYMAGFREAVDTVLLPGAADPALDERHEHFRRNGVPLASPDFIKNWIAQRRAYLLGVLPAAPFAVTNPAWQVVGGVSNTVRLAGFAPLAADAILVNGSAYPVAWTSVTNWTVTVPLAAGTNVLAVVARGRDGVAIPGAAATNTVYYSGAAAAPEGFVVFNEIHHAPDVAGGGFVELFNAHATATFDLSNWRVDGLDYVFPAGATLPPRGFLALAEDPFVYNRTYGTTNVAFDRYDGRLDSDGETLTLWRPGTGTNEAVVDRVRYEAAAPWPAPAAGFSLQLADAAQDNSRVANWRVYDGPDPAARCTPGAANSVVTNLPPFPPLWLNEMQADNLTGPSDNHGEREPWAELYNAAGTNVSLAGFYLSDTYTNLAKWAFPAGASVPAGGFTVAWCDGETNESEAGSIHAGFRPSSGGGRLALSRMVSNSVQLVDYLNYTNLAPNWSYGDVPDGQPFYRRAMFFATAGATNSGASAPIAVFVNEWMADNGTALADPADGGYEDWFELYNPGSNAVDIGGYFLTDDLADPFQFRIPDNGHYIVPAGGFLLVWADSETGQNSTNRVDLHAGFALGKNGDAIGLFAADGTAIDAVVFGAQDTDISEGRFPDGAANAHPMPTPTPRAPNVVPNTAPALEAIADRAVTLGRTVSFTAVATDADVPPQTLSYGLSGGAPAGAAIDPSGGLFSWTPSATVTAAIGVVVTDSGTPAMSATQSFTVAVSPPPEMAGLAIDGGGLAFRWLSLSGQAYRVEFKDDLLDPLWTAVPSGGDLPGTGGPLSFTNWIDAESARRFFRIRLVP